MVGRKIEDNLLFCRGECEGGIIDGFVDDVDDVAAFGWSTVSCAPMIINYDGGGFTCCMDAH